VKNRAIAVAVGALLTLLLWAIAFAVLNGIYRGDLPWMLTGLAALLCPAAGGYAAARLSQTNQLALGTLGGLCGGLIVLVAGALASRFAPNTTLAGVGLASVGALGGCVGALLGRVQRIRKRAASTGMILMLVLVALAGLATACSAGGKAAQPDLAGTEWTLVSLNGGPLLAETEIDLYFEETYLGGEMTCNGYGGSPDRGGYRATKGGEISTGMLAMTVEACPTPKGVLEQEAAYVEALRAATRYRVVEGSLEIEDAAGAIKLVFAPK
jgi:heat shock protein HslJ